FTGLEPLIGIRCVSLQERFSFFTDDDNISFPEAFGGVDTTRIATYTSRVTNTILAPQLGVEYQKCVPYLKGVAYALSAKSAVGVDIADMPPSLTRGDGFVGFRGTRHRYNLSSVIELGAYLDIYMLERLRLRGGYTAMWLVNVPEAVDQVGFDLSMPNGRK